MDPWSETFWITKKSMFFTTLMVHRRWNRRKHKKSLFFRKKMTKNGPKNRPFFRVFFAFFVFFLVVFITFFHFTLENTLKMTFYLFFACTPKMTIFWRFFTFFTFFVIFGRFSALTTNRTQKWPLKMTPFWDLFLHFFSTFLLYHLVLGFIFESSIFIPFFETVIF